MFEIDLKNISFNVWGVKVLFLLPLIFHCMKNRGEIFTKYRNSVLPIGIGFYKNKNRSIDPKYLMQGKIDGEKVSVLPTASAFILKIDENTTQLVTANHAFPNIKKGDNDLFIFVVPNSENPCELSRINRDDVKAYPGIKDYLRLPDQDICIFEVDTPERLYQLKPRALPIGPDFQIGDPVFTMGYPFIGYEGTDQKGISNFRFVNRLTSAYLSSIWIENDTLIMEFDNYVGPGNSGGPLINLRTGSVIGIVTTTRTEANPNFPGFENMTTFSHATYITELNRAREKFSNIPDFGCHHCYSKK